MKRIFLLTAFVVSNTAGVASAQMNPASIGLGMVMPSALNAQAKNLSKRKAARGRVYSEQSARNCASVPEWKRDAGQNDPTILKLERMCRDAGYSTGS